MDTEILFILNVFLRPLGIPLFNLSLEVSPWSYIGISTSSATALIRVMAARQEMTHSFILLTPSYCKVMFTQLVN